MQVADAWEQVEEWLDCDPAWSPDATAFHREVMSSLVPQVGTRPNLIPDALAIENGLTLCSTDRDFARFSELKWENPLR